MKFILKAPHGQQATFNCRAFTLLEVMIVCSLIAILTAIAVPSYQQYVLRTERAAAIEHLLAAVSCQQRLYASEFSFDTGRCLPGVVVGKYEFRFEPPNNEGISAFVVFAEPLGSQAEDVCGDLSLAHTGFRQISGPAERTAKCWESR